MDPAAVFQQAVGSVLPTRGPQQYFYHPHPAYQPPSTFSQPAQQPSAPLRRPPTQHRDEDDGNSHRIAHTLTACCRCRQASTLRLWKAPHVPCAWCNSSPSQNANVAVTTSVKQDATQLFHDAFHVNDPDPYASILIPPGARRSAVYTLSDCRRRSGSLRLSSRSTPTRTMITPKAQRTWCGRVALSS